MNFFQQYKDLFQVGNYPSIPNTRLRLDNQLFIDKPYIPTYTQQHSLNSKLRELKKDYNEFESQVKQLYEIEDLQKNTNSRIRQGKLQNTIASSNNNNNSNNSNKNNNNNNTRSIRNTDKPSPSLNENNSRNMYSHNKYKSTIFDHYQQNKSQYLPQKQTKLQKSLSSKNNLPQLTNHNNTLNNQPTFGRNKSPYPGQSPLGNYQQQPNQKQNKQLNNSYKGTSSLAMRQNQQAIYQKQLLESLRKQSQDNTAKLVKNQNSIKNKFYQQDTNNVLKQSEINHIFNWKLQKPSTFDKLDVLPQSTIPKYKIQTSVLEPRQRQPIQQGKNFAIRNVPSTNQIKPNNRNKIVPQQKQYNVPNKNSSAQERRRIAKQNIDDRRQRLKIVLKAFF